jgi:hypothetical protein
MPDIGVRLPAAAPTPPQRRRVTGGPLHRSACATRCGCCAGRSLSCTKRSLTYGRVSGPSRGWSGSSSTTSGGGAAPADRRGRGRASWPAMGTAAGTAAGWRRPSTTSCPGRGVARHVAEHGGRLWRLQSAQGRPDAGRGADADAVHPARPYVGRPRHALMRAGGAGFPAGPLGADVTRQHGCL